MHINMESVLVEGKMRIPFEQAAMLTLHKHISKELRHVASSKRDESGKASGVRDYWQRAAEFALASSGPSHPRVKKSTLSVLALCLRHHAAFLRLRERQRKCIYFPYDIASRLQQKINFSLPCAKCFFKNQPDICPNHGEHDIANITNNVSLQT
jgi:hypothetical protein